jgi:hypothetical protein
LSNLSNRGPLGLRAPKPVNGTAACKRHMAAVAALPCLVCGRYGVEVHHLTKPRNDMEVIPLCAPHHRREFGPNSYEYSPKAFHAEHGDERLLLAKVADMLAGEFNSPWGRK